jgi:hypothetical protein
MKTQRLAVVLTPLSVVLMVALISQFRAAAAQSDTGLLRGRGLEIVDAQGRVRAQIVLTDDTATARTAK